MGSSLQIPRITWPLNLAGWRKSDAIIARCVTRSTGTMPLGRTGWKPAFHCPPNERTIKGLQSRCHPSFNEGMKLKTLMGVIAAGFIVGSAAFGQTLKTFTGTVSAVTDNQIMLQSGSESWIINRTATTKVISGTLTAVSTVTIQCDLPDSQKKEAPSSATPAPEGG